METIPIHTPFIQLNQALKLLGWAESGSMANDMITEGLVVVDGVQEFRRRNKLYPGAVIEFEGQKATVLAE
ncbi:ribosome-associated protein [Bacteroidota bacterium]|nr:ribosome-associated protein [Bacteroidota bacterium]